MKATDYVSTKCMVSTLSLLIGILTGYNTLRRNLLLIGVEEDPTCAQCANDEETLTATKEFSLVLISRHNENSNKFFKFGDTCLGSELFLRISWQQIT